MCHLLLLEHILFPHLLHGDHLPVLSESAYSHLTEGSSADNSEQIEILHGDLLPSKLAHY
jgi:hypothetical protein